MWISAEILALGPLQSQQITSSLFRIFLQSDWQMNNGFLTGQPWWLVHRYQEQGFWCWFADGLEQRFNFVFGASSSFFFFSFEWLFWLFSQQYCSCLKMRDFITFNPFSLLFQCDSSITSTSVLDDSTVPSPGTVVTVIRPRSSVRVPVKFHPRDERLRTSVVLIR